MLALLAVSALAGADALLDFAVPHWLERPAMTTVDAYKWLYQATRGGEHAVTSDVGPRKWLEQEWDSLGALEAQEPLAEALRPDGRVLRVYLRPYRDGGGDREMLLALFVASARSFEARKGEFVDAWRRLGERLQKRSIGRLDHRSWRRLDRDAHSLGYPAYHHSATYERAYKPAYRVILGELWLPPFSEDR